MVTLSKTQLNARTLEHEGWIEFVCYLFTPEDSREGFAGQEQTSPSLLAQRTKAIFWWLLAIVFTGLIVQLH